MRTLPTRRSLEAVDLLESFLVSFRESRQVSPHTLRAYRADLTALLRFGEEQGVADPRRMDTLLLREHLGELEAPSRATLARKQAALRGFFGWLRRTGRMEHDPAASLRTPRRGRHLPRTLDEGQVEQLLASAGGDTDADLRDRAVLELLYSTGMRVAECAGLDLPHLDLRGGSVRVYGKGRKERMGLVGGPAREAVGAAKCWWNSPRPGCFRRHTRPDDIFFCIYSGGCDAPEIWHEPCITHTVMPNRSHP